MARAMARGRKPDAPEPHDDITERLLEAAEWAKRHARALIVALVVVALGVGALVYYIDYRATLEAQAAVELQELVGTLQASEPERAATDLRTFIERYGGTEATEEARLFLARMHLAGNEAEQALDVLEPLSDAPADTPLGYGAHTLIAAAHEAAGQPEQALDALETVGREARYPFQRRRARANRARLLVQGGQLERAAEIYASLVEEASEADGADAEAAEYRVRLAEVRARLASGAPPEDPGRAGGGASAAPAPADGAPAGADTADESASAPAPAEAEEADTAQSP